MPRGIGQELVVIVQRVMPAVEKVLHIVTGYPEHQGVA